MVANMKRFSGFAASLLATCAGLGVAAWSPLTLAAGPGTVTVTAKSAGVPINVGYRWLLEEDSTWYVDPGQPDADTTTATLALNMHKSHMTVVASGHSDANPASIPVPDTAKRYFLTILPDQHDAGADPRTAASRDCAVPGNCFTQSGRQVTPELFNGGSTATLSVTLAGQPVPTAQIFARAFQDSRPINGVWDNGEAPLGGWTVFIYDMGGQMMTDTFGHPLGTVYDADGNVVRLGDGTLHTMTAEEAADPARNPYGIAEGEVLVKGIAPGKYGIRIVPPAGQKWQQTSTIEGTPGLDTWVKANEPRYFAEFGPAGHHAEFGFITTNGALSDFPKSASDPDYVPPGGNSISGRIVNMRMARPPEVGFSGGHPLPGCWVGLNNQAGTRGLVAVPCDEDSHFSFPGLADGTYQLVIWDTYLDNIIATQTVQVGAGAPAPNGDLGDVPVFRWFGAHEHWVFNDLNGNGVRDPGEKGIPDQTINLRYRDGSIYASSTTDTEGYLPFDEIFPFFSWLIAEVDYARFNATGVTVVSDAGGPVLNDDKYGRGKLNPQTQDPAECADGSDGTAERPGLCLARKEVAQWNPTDPTQIVPPPLLEGYNSFLGTTEVFEWGKKAWNKGENGGITGVVYYQTTRAENDPRFAAPETWEPGIPRVQVALYHSDATGRLYHKGVGGVRGDVAGPASPIVLADVDNYPLGNFPGVEDVDHNGNSAFDLGDAIEVAHTDSYDDSLPEGCRPHQNPDGTAKSDPFYLDGKCYDALRNYSQVRPAVFDGGYAFGKPFTTTTILPGYYVVQASPPRGADGKEVYEIQQEEDKNVDFGDQMKISTQALPPYCVGGIATDGTVLDNGVQPHDAGNVLALFSTSEGPIAIDPRYTGQRPGCDFRLVQVTDGKNAAADFFMFTETPITGHIQGFVLNDVANEFDPNSPNFGEKMAPSWIPVSVRDYAGNEVYHTYTDKWGTYNAIVPSAFRINTPMPSGVSPNMLQVCLNAPTMQDADGNWVPEPRQNPQFTQFCYTLDFKPGQTTYLDTPVLPIAAFVGPGNWQLDCEYPSGTPVVRQASAANNAGPYVSTTNRRLTIWSMGRVNVPDPLADRVDGTVGGGSNLKLVERDFGFGDTQGRVWIGTTEITGANVVSWTADSIVVDVPAGAATGQLRIRRSNSMETVHGLTITIDKPEAQVHHVTLGQSIQAAIDAAKPGDLIIVQPGTYLEMLVMTKPIQLQGWGAATTIINPVQSPTEKIAAWRDKLNYLANCTHEIGLLPNQPNNAAGSGACGFVPGTGLFANEEGAGVLVAPAAGVFGGAVARIDGFTISGADQSGGVLVNGYATGLEISNNIIRNNQGPYAAGIRVGQPLLLQVDDATGTETPVDAQNDNIRIHHNHVTQNGGLFEAGAGIGLYTGSDGYQVSRNYVCGNNAGGNGAGVAHYGLSTNGRIADNKILFNQAFDQTVANSGNGGGIAVAGYAIVGGGTPGVGSVDIERNLIQGNNAGSGRGGGISVQLVAQGGGNNPQKLVRIINNVIANNVAGYAGGGIAMDSAARVTITNNTIVNNDSSGTAALAFCNAGAPSQSCPQPAGVVADGGNIGNEGFRNNIVLGNRAYHITLGTDGGVTSVLDGYWDLNGTALYSGGAGSTNGIRNSLLSAAGAFNGGDSVPVLGSPGSYCSATRANTCVTPTATLYGSHFVDAYFNVPPSFSTTGTYTPPEAATLAGLSAGPSVAAATDEGGNFIDVHFGPLSQVICDTNKATCAGTPTPGTTEVLSDYHLRSTANNAIDQVGTGNGAAPANDIDGQTRKTASNPANPTADRGADEYHSGYVAGSTPIDSSGGGVANSQPDVPQIAPNQRAMGGALYTYQVRATDPNGDPLRYALTTAPAGMTIDAGAGLISWTPVFGVNQAAPTGCGTVTNNTLTTTCAVTVTVTDGIIPTPIARSFQISLRRYTGGGPGSQNATFQVGTMGTFTVPAPGVLTINNGTTNGGYATLTARLVVDSTAAAGKLTLGADGAVTFVPKADWVGSVTFTFRAFDGVNQGNVATATLTRQIAVPTARYIDGTWTFQGLGSSNNRRIHIVRDRGPVDVTTSGTRPTVAGGTWQFTRNGGPDFQTGDTVTILSETNGGQSNFSLVGVPVILGAADNVYSTAHVQCPIDADNDGMISDAEAAAGRAMNPPVVCRHLAAGDGFSVMADGTELYTFGFNDVTHVPANKAIAKGILNAQFPAPTLDFDEGDEVYLSLTNVGMLMRPDLFDPHSVHFHGFPNAAAVFDGVPESSITINMGFSLTYYYKTLDPGTYMYHCHVEAAEHMQMGMLGNLYVRPKQNRTGGGAGVPQSRLGGNPDSGAPLGYVYNDGDGSTAYDVEFPIQIGSFDRNFHEEHIGVQPLPFAGMHDDYPMLNGRGYPDTMVAGNLPAAPSKSDPEVGVVSGDETSQPMNTRIVIPAGKKALLRISNLNVTRFYTLATTGLPMKVVGTGAHILRGPAGGAAANMYYSTNSVTLGGGEGVDVIVDTTGVAPGTYLLYSTNLEALSNGSEDYGGMMTEIVVQ